MVQTLSSPEAGSQQWVLAAPWRASRWAPAGLTWVCETARGRRMGSIVPQTVTLPCVGPISVLWEAPKRLRNLLPLGTGTVNSFSKDNNQLRLFYLFRRTKAVVFYTSWMRNTRQAQASGPPCMFTCLFGPSMGAEHTRMQAACRGVSWATAASRSRRRRLLPAKHMPSATHPLWQGRCFAIFCVHVHISLRALGLFGCIQTASTLEESQGSICPPHCSLPHRCRLCMTPN